MDEPNPSMVHPLGTFFNWKIEKKKKNTQISVATFKMNKLVLEYFK